MLLIKYTP